MIVLLFLRLLRDLIFPSFEIISVIVNVIMSAADTVCCRDAEASNDPSSHAYTVTDGEVARYSTPRDEQGIVTVTVPGSGNHAETRACVRVIKEAETYIDDARSHAG